MLYEFHCECGRKRDEFRPVANRNDPMTCECGLPMERVIAPYSAHSDLTPYYDDNLETFIESKRRRQKVMREKDVYEYYGKGWR